MVGDAGRRNSRVPAARGSALAPAALAPAALAPAALARTHGAKYPGAMAAFDTSAFRSVMGSFATGITVVTAEHAGQICGMTASAFLSVSLDPPLVLVSVARSATLHARVVAAGRYAVSMLGAGGEAVSNHFAGRPTADAEIRFTREASATPVLLDALAWVDCSLESAVEAGDHTLFIGRVEALGRREGAPLVYYRGKYRELRED